MISVIIPVFNIKDCLEICLKSLLNQSFKDFEVILVDDGSTDGTAGICDEYAKNQQITVIHKENEGQAVARNVGIDAAHGDYIAFVDGDDWVREDYLEILYNTAIAQHADIVNCKFVRTKTRNTSIGEDKDNSYKYKVTNYDSEKAIENLCYLKELNCAPYSKLFKRYLWDDIKFPQGVIYEDLGTIYKTFDKANIISFINYSGYFYYQRTGSSLNSPFSVKKLSRVKFAEEIHDFIMQYYPEIVSASNCRLFWSAAGALMDIPFKYPEQNLNNQIFDIVKATRIGIILDRDCRGDVRALAGLSLFGRKSFKIVLSMYKLYKGLTGA